MRLSKVKVHQHVSSCSPLSACELPSGKKNCHRVVAIGATQLISRVVSTLHMCMYKEEMGQGKNTTLPTLTLFQRLH